MAGCMCLKKTRIKIIKLMSLRFQVAHLYDIRAALQRALVVVPAICVVENAATKSMDVTMLRQKSARASTAPCHSSESWRHVADRIARIMYAYGHIVNTHI